MEASSSGRGRIGNWISRSSSECILRATSVIDRPPAKDGHDSVLLSAAFTDKTKVVIINTPHNPSGKVFTREELTAIAEICTKHDVLVLADEVVSTRPSSRSHHAEVEVLISK